MRLDISRVIIASSVVTRNHRSCVHINLETGDGLYADSIGQEVPCDFEHLATFFKQYSKYTKKTMTLLNPCKFLMRFDQQNACRNVETSV